MPTARFQSGSPRGKAIDRHSREIVALAQARKIRNVRVFGSVARGEDNADSDIDFLIDLEPGADLLDLAALNLALERLLGYPVDIVPARMLKPRLAAAALAEAVKLLPEEGHDSP